MRDISMERVNETREKMLETVKSPTLTHEQKVATMANLADSLLEVVDWQRDTHRSVPGILSRIMRNL